MTCVYQVTYTEDEVVEEDDVEEANAGEKGDAVSSEGSEEGEMTVPFVCSFCVGQV